jgi:hypothetical protein
MDETNYSEAYVSDSKFMPLLIAHTSIYLTARCDTALARTLTRTV